MCYIHTFWLGCPSITSPASKNNNMFSATATIFKQKVFCFKLLYLHLRFANIVPNPLYSFFHIVTVTEPYLNLARFSMYLNSAIYIISCDETTLALL